MAASKSYQRSGEKHTRCPLQGTSAHGRRLGQRTTRARLPCVAVRYELTTSSGSSPTNFAYSRRNPLAKTGAGSTSKRSSSSAPQIGLADLGDARRSRPTTPHVPRALASASYRRLSLGPVQSHSPTEVGGWPYACFRSYVRPGAVDLSAEPLLKNVQSQTRPVASNFPNRSEMTIPRTLRKYIEAGRLDEAESAWLTQMETDPTDCRLLRRRGPCSQGGRRGGVGSDAARALVRGVAGRRVPGAAAGSCWRKSVLLMLRVGGSCTRRSSRSCEPSIAGPPTSRASSNRWASSELSRDVPKSWKKVRNLRAILQFEIDSIVWMKGKGAGRVTEVNFELENFKIDFERSPGLRVGFLRRQRSSCAHYPGDHILRRKIEDREALLEIKDRDPCRAPSADVAQLRRARAMRPRYARHWRESSMRRNGARGGPLRARTPKYSPWARGRGSSTLAAASSADAEEAVIAAFAAADTSGKLEIFRRNADRERSVAAGSRSPAGGDCAMRSGVERSGSALRRRARSSRTGPELPTEADWLPERRRRVRDGPPPR